MRGIGTPTLADSAVGQSGIQPLGRLSHQLRLHHLPDLVEPLLCRRQQLASRTTGRIRPIKTRRRATEFPPQTTGWKEKGICIPNWPDCNLNFPIEKFIDGIHTWGVGAPNGSDNIVVEFRDDMTKVHGSHTFKWGYYYNNTHYNGFGLTEHCRVGRTSPISTPPSRWTPASKPEARSRRSCWARRPAIASIRRDILPASIRTHQMYFQDDWRVIEEADTEPRAAV